MRRSHSDRHREFAHTVLFSATTPEVAAAAGKPDRAALLRQLREAGGELVVFPLAEEYTTLIRFVGPMAGYLACLQFTAQLAGCRFRVPPAEAFLPLLAAAPPCDLLQAMLDTPEIFARGFNLVCAAPISEFAQNLACKFMEGVFWPCPPISDLLQFAHGPFQQMSAHPQPVVILQGDSPLEAELVRRSVRMLRRRPARLRRAGERAAALLHFRLRGRLQPAGFRPHAAASTPTRSTGPAKAATTGSTASARTHDFHGAGDQRLALPSSFLSRLVVCVRSSREAATSSTRDSHAELSGVGSTPFKRRKTMAAVIAVRLLPSLNGWLRQR